ncbi:cytochrome c3 family protein [Sphingobium sp. Sx8-8]|uniref:HNH endonuclease n=1 Tax=Sphingobium sp. Sx8-8 TaxID=2933617 RepID=UPI001F59AF58|nr:cytochrome c3 family protein [Sphingobium sp. Sx8-8]
MSVSVLAMEIALAKLTEAVVNELPRSRCLRRWSEFIRMRDGYRCVDCHSPHNLAAHHIFRKSLSTNAQFETGNGITLCRECHRDAHSGFNGRPNFGLPVDAQGGEKLPMMRRFYSILLDDAIERHLERTEFYFLSESTLHSFKEMQGYPDAEFPGCPLEQAFLILAEPELKVRNAIAKENGFSFGDQPLLPGGILFVSPDGRRRIIKRYQLRWRN